MKLLRYKNLKERRIVENRMTLHRRIKFQGFPKPIALGPNSVAWIEEEVNQWLTERAASRDRRAA